VSPGSSGHTATSRRRQSPGQRDISPWRVVRRPPCSRTRLCVGPARWRSSSCPCRPKLGGALNTSHPPPRPRPSAAPCWPIRRRSWSRERRASCGPSGPHATRASPLSASSAALRCRQAAQARRSINGERRRRPREGPSRGDDAGCFFLGGGFPVVNWGKVETVSVKYLGRGARTQESAQRVGDGPNRTPTPCTTALRPRQSTHHS
jgi:hypothetical protein